MKKLIIDNDYEYYTNHKNEEVYLIDFSNLNYSNYINPLLLPYAEYKKGNMDKTVEMVNKFSKNLFYEEKSSDPFWINTSSDLFTGLVLFLYEKGEVSEINLDSVVKMASDLFNNNDLKIGFMNYIDGEKSLGSAAIFLSNSLHAPSDTAKSIFSVFSQKLHLYLLREELNTCLSNNDINDDRDIIVEQGEKYQNLTKGVIELLEDAGYMTNHTVEHNIIDKKLIDISQFVN